MKMKHMVEGEAFFLGSSAGRITATRRLKAFTILVHFHVD